MNNDINKKIVHAAPVPPFVRFVASAVPMVFDNSLSYYECLCALWKWMQDNLVDVINNNATVTEHYIDLDLETRALFNQLKTYVDTYFDNLDVQDEINNKLDAMAEAGTLQEIITAYIQANVAWTFDTVADMKAATNLVNGSYAQTLGFYDKDDFGGASYKIRNILENETPDEAFVISISDELVAELVVDKTLYSKQVGLKGDGTTDETTLLNTFFDKSLDCSKIVNSGTYVISDTVFINGNWNTTLAKNTQQTKFENAGIKYTGTADDYSVIIYNFKRGVIDGLTIDVSSNRNKVGIIGCWETKFKNFNVDKLVPTNNGDLLLGKTYHTRSVQHLTFENTYVIGNVIIDAYDDSYINGLYFNESVINANHYSSEPSLQDDYCVVLLGTKSKENIIFTNCDLSYSAVAIFDVHSKQVGLYASSLGTGTVELNGCYFDSTIPLVKDHNCNNMSFSIKNCIFAGNNTTMNPTLSYKEFLQNTQLNSSTVFPDYLPTGNVNLVYNGDFSTNGTYGMGSRIIGDSSETAVKSWETSTRNRFGRCRKIVLTADATLRSDMVKTPTEGMYTYAIRFMITSGNPTIRLFFGESGEASSYYSNLPLNKEIILTTNKGLYISETNKDLQPKISIQGGTALSPVTVEFYEVIVTPGRFILPNMPLHNGAIIAGS